MLRLCSKHRRVCELTTSARAQLTCSILEFVSGECTSTIYKVKYREIKIERRFKVFQLIYLFANLAPTIQHLVAKSRLPGANAPKQPIKVNPCVLENDFVFLCLQ